MGYGFTTECGHKHRFLFFFTRKCGKKLTIVGGSVSGFWEMFEKMGWRHKDGISYCPKHREP